MQSSHSVAHAYPTEFSHTAYIRTYVRTYVRTLLLCEYTAVYCRSGSAGALLHCEQYGCTTGRPTYELAIARLDSDRRVLSGPVAATVGWSSQVLYDEQGAVAGIATGDVGIAKDGSLKVRTAPFAQSTYRSGMESNGPRQEGNSVSGIAHG